MKPLMVDLFAGLGGWAEGGIAEGYYVVGFDIEQHVYGEHRYPAQLVIQDVLTIHGSQFKDAALIVASPPCQEYSYMAMPWSLAKAKQAKIEADPAEQKRLTALFDACFRIQREACEAAGRHIPLVVENVKGAQKWVGRARGNFGSFYLWGDVPALMPVALGRQVMKNDVTHRSDGSTNFHGHKNKGGSWFNIGSPGQKETNRNPIHELTGQKTTAHLNKRNGHRSTAHLTNPAEHGGVHGHKNKGGSWFNSGSPGQKETNRNPVHEFVSGIKQPGLAGTRNNGKGDRWFQDGAAKHGSKSNARKAASAMIAKIPLTLSRHIAQVWKPINEFPGGHRS